MSEMIKVCVDRFLAPDEIEEGASRAIAENPSNAPMSRPRAGFGVVPALPLRMAVITEKRWRPGRSLRVRFLDGDARVQTKVEQYARQWIQHANVNIVFGSDPDSEIRIAFREGDGSWSYLGTDALSVSRARPTMNFGWLTPASKDEEYSRVVLHEFGHALACIHEHQHPEAGIPWDREAVYAYYTTNLGWSKAQVDANLFQVYGREMTQFSTFDRDSIMLYPIPNALTIGDYEVGWNTRLSGKDQTFIGSMYPFEQAPIIELEMGAPPIEASIGAHGEEDRFRFVVETAARYAIETEGPTDVVVGLFGPDSETNLAAEDDDSGRDWNAKIVAPLTPGAYYVRVRHYAPTGTGQYRISVGKVS